MIRWELHHAFKSLSLSLDWWSAGVNYLQYSHLEPSAGLRACVAFMRLVMRNIFCPQGQRQQSVGRFWLSHTGDSAVRQTLKDYARGQRQCGLSPCVCVIAELSQARAEGMARL